ncbi:helix-turn-helix domain-containing protein [Candidatus Bathyarchaeota archaeon]|nr:helix-turn-helix domain-containing protein [Candidatus Bathyarchaeota archaeon]
MARIVIVELAVKARIYPNAAQEELLAKTLGCKRWCWNHWLEERETYFKEHSNITGFKYTSAIEIKKTRPLLKEPKTNRKHIRLPKTHYIDALVIASRTKPLSFKIENMLKEVVSSGGLG